MDLRVYGIRETKIYPAAFQDDLIEMADPGFPAPFMDLVKINFGCVTLQIKRKIAEKPDPESAVQIMLQHVMDHIKNVFCRRQDGVAVSVDRLDGFFQMGR